MVSPHHFLLCRYPFECDHLLRLHNDNNYPSFPFTYSPTRNSNNITWTMMNHVDVERGGPPWLAHNYPISLMLEHLYKSSCENLDLDQGSPTMALLCKTLCDVSHQTLMPQPLKSPPTTSTLVASYKVENVLQCIKHGRTTQDYNVNTSYMW